MLDFYLTKGNHKLSNNIIIFTLPSGETCPGAGECIDWCYSRKAELAYPKVKAARQRNWKATLEDSFVNEMIKNLQEQIRKGKNVLRLHQDGDFYSQEYLNKWKEISRNIPELKIFAYTKSFNLDLWTNLPNNFIILQSYGSKWDEKIDPEKNTARVIKEISDLDNKNEYLCPYHDKINFTKCGECCNYCFNDIIKIKHVAFLQH